MQIEHALDLSAPTPLCFSTPTAPRRRPSPSAKSTPGRARADDPWLAPEAVLQVFAQSRAAPPPAFVLGMRGERFGLGEGLSATGAAALTAAGEFCEQLSPRARWRIGGV